MDLEGRKLLLIFLVLGFTASVAGSATLQSPSDGAAFNYGDTIDFTVSVSGSGGTVKFYRDGVNVENFAHCDAGCSNTYTSSYTPDSGADGSHTWHVEYTGSTDGSDETTPTRDYYVEDDAYFADLTTSNPSDGASLISDSITFDYGGSFGEPGSLELYAETCTGYDYFNLESVSGGSSYSFSHTLDYSNCYGTFSWSPYYTGDDGSTEALGVYNSFTIESDASQLTELSNAAPNDGSTFNGDLNQEYNVGFEVGQGGTDSGEVNLYVDGSLQHTWTSADLCNSCTTTLTTSQTFSDGNYDWYVEFVGDDGSTSSTASDSFEIEDYSDRTSITLDGPNDGATVTTSDVDFQYSGSGEDGDVKLYVDGNLESTKSFPGSTSNTYTTTVSGLSNGDHNWYVEYVGDDGSSKTTSTRTVTVDSPTDAEETTLSNENPSDGALFIGTDTSINYEASVSGNSGTVKIFSDTCSGSGQEIHSESYGGSSSYLFSTSKTWNCEGTFDWYAKYIGDDGSSKTTASDSFTIDSEASQTSLTLINPSSGETVNDTNGDVTFEVEKSGEGGEVELYVDGVSRHNWTLSCSACTEALSHTVNGLSDGSHSWYAKYKGTDGSTSTTSSKDFSVDSTTDAEETNVSADDPVDGYVFDQETVQYNYSVSGASGTLELYRNGTKINTDSYGGLSSQTYSYSENLSNGDYDYYVKYVGDDGSTKKTSTKTFSVDAPLDSNIYLDTPTEGQVFKEVFPLDVEYNFEVSGEDGQVNIFQNGSNIKTFTHSRGQNKAYSYNQSFSTEGSYDYYVEYVRDSDSQTVTSSTRTFEVVEKENVSLTYSEPTTGDSIPYLDTTNFSYSILTDHSGNLDLMLNGSGINSHSVSAGTDTGFSYSENLSEGEYSSRLRFVSDSGKTHYSSYSNFTVEGKPVEYINDVEYRYRDIGGSPEQSIVVDLNGSSKISDHNNAPGDTASFNSEEWVIENVSLPYSGSLEVNDTEGEVSSRNIDFDVSVDSIKGHDANSNPDYQEKNRTIRVDNSGEDFSLNLSCSNNGYGEAVTGSVDTVVSVSGSSARHACRWSGDWITSSYGDADPTEDDVILGRGLSVGRNVTLDNSESVTFPKINVSGYAEPENGCEASKNYLIETPSTGVTEQVGFECIVGDPGDPSLRIESNGDADEYFLETTLSMSSNLSENISISWRFDKPQDWSIRDQGSAEVAVDNQSEEVLLLEGSDFLEIEVTDNYGNSSLHIGDYPAVLYYSQSSDGSGFTGGLNLDDGVEDDTTQNREEWGIQWRHTNLSTEYGTVNPEEYLIIQNYANAPNQVNITIPDTEGCQYFHVQERAGIGYEDSSEFSKEGKYRLPSSSEGLGDYSTMPIQVRVELPNETKMNSTGFSCKPEIGVEVDKAMPLTLWVKPDISIFDRVVENLKKLGVPDTDVLFFEDVCTDPSDAASGETECEDGKTLNLNTVLSLAAVIVVGTVLLVAAGFLTVVTGTFRRLRGIF